MADDKTMKLYSLRHAKDHKPVCFDGVSIVCNNISALVFIVEQARDTSDGFSDAMEIVDAETGQVVMDIEGQK